MANLTGRLSIRFRALCAKPPANLRVACIQFSGEVVDELVRIGFVYHQQILWSEGCTVLTGTHHRLRYQPSCCASKGGASCLVRPARTDDLGFAFPELHPGQLHAADGRSPGTEPGRADSAVDSRLHKARRAGLPNHSGQSKLATLIRVQRCVALEKRTALSPESALCAALPVF